MNHNPHWEHSLITIISPVEFKKIPWKNGLGETTELAISAGDSVADFSWRLSIASVVEPGVFSDFSGYYRQLILISGAGITLTHDELHTDCLVQLLDVAAFDGGCHTVGSLHHGPIHDFNVMVKKGVYQATVNTYVNNNIVNIDACELCFVYGINTEIELREKTDTGHHLPAGHLMKIAKPQAQQFQLGGERFIVIYLHKVTGN